MKPSPETAKVLSESEELSLLVKGRGWGIVRKKLLDTIMSLSDILSLPKNQAELIQQLGARQIAVEVLVNWLREIEGTAANNATFQEVMKDFRDDYIKHYDEQA